MGRQPASSSLLDFANLSYAFTFPPIADATTEKLFRASLQSSTERLLSKNSITVLDSINGIKGVRYQLYCSAKSIPTQYCVVYIACSKEVSVEWNEKREERYTKEQMDDLWTRFEEPDGRNRWDSPLFTILPDDDLTKPDASGVSIIDRIAAVMTGDPLKQNMSTMRNPVSESTYIQDLDRALMNVCESIVAHQSDFGAHCPPLSIPGCTAKLTIPPRIVGMAELRRLKKGWEALNKLRRVEETGRAVESFVEYLNGIW